MAYTYNPTSAESALLAQIAQRESGGDYTAQNATTSASGAYQFVDATWQLAAQKTGVGAQYASAGDAPANVQDINALWLLRTYGANASISWGASGPYNSTQPLVDLSGQAATTSSADILSQLGSMVSGAGVDLTDPTTEIAIALGVGLVAYLALA